MSYAASESGSERARKTKERRGGERCFLSLPHTQTHTQRDTRNELSDELIEINQLLVNKFI